MFKSQKVCHHSDRGGILSRFAFCWVMSILWKVRQNKFQGSDVTTSQAFPENECAGMGYKLSRSWKHELNRRVQPRLSRALIRVYGWQFSTRTVLGILKDGVLKAALGPALWILLSYFNGSETFEVGMRAACALVFISATNSIFQNTSMYLWEELGMKIRIGLNALIYQKVLRLNQITLTKISSQQISSLFWDELKQFDKHFRYISYLILGPIQAISITSVLCFYIGPTAPIIIPVLAVLISIQAWIEKQVIRNEHIAISESNARIRLTEQIFDGIELMKMSACEAQYIESVSRARRAEVESLKQKWTRVAVNNSFYDVSSKFVFIATLFLYILFGNIISADVVFVMLTLTNCLRETLGIPRGIAGLSQIRISLRRIEVPPEFRIYIQSYVSRPEPEFRDSLKFYFPMPNLTLKSSTQKLLKSEYCGPECVKSDYNFLKVFVSKYTSPKLSLQRASAGWSESGDNFTFADISLEALPGDLIIITGANGSGKSSLLQAILGEFPLKHGRIEVVGNVAYTSEDPWMLSGSVQENILLGRPYDHEWYTMVVEACGLSRDLYLLPNGDLTPVGNKGLIADTGFQTRINLARAVYANADVYLLDDPLSFLDSETRNHVFEKCIRGILKTKLVVLVTGRKEYFARASEIIILNKGSIEIRGNQNQIRANGCNSDADCEYPLELERNGNFMEDGEAPSEEECADLCEQQKECTSYGTFADEAKPSTAKSNDGQTSWTRSTRWNWTYLVAGNSGFKVLFLLIVAATLQGVLSFSDYWLKIWTAYEAYLRREAPELEEPQLYFEAYASLLAVGFLLSLIRNHIIISIGMSSSMALHGAFVTAVIRAPLVLVKRSLADCLAARLKYNIQVIDEALPQLYYLSINNIFQIVGSLLLISLMMPIMSIPAVILLILTFFFRQFYVQSAAALRRMKISAENTIYDHLDNNIKGLPTIRALRAEQPLETQFHEVVDAHTSIQYIILASKAWLRLVLDVILSFFLISLMYVCFTSAVDTPAAMGLVIASALNLAFIFSSGIAESAQLNIELESVAKICEYSGLQPEGPLLVSSGEILTNWPSQGKIDLKQVSVRCGNSSTLLHGITLGINHGERIAVYCPMGLESNAITSTLFRLMEPSAGVIRIADLDISTIGLHDLRSKLCFIPLRPIRINGTIRKNLDPFNQYTDKELWTALDEVHFSDRIESLSPAGLDTKIGMGTSNFSHEDTQLLLLARATLTRCKIIILDQRSARCIDSSSDAVIRKTLEEKFKSCTIITLTNRLSVVTQCDRVCVMDSGKILEFDDPCILLQNPETYLQRAARKFGAAELTNAIRRAAEGHEERNMRRTKN